MYTWVGRTNCFDDDVKKWWRMKEWGSLIAVWNKRSMKSGWSWLTCSFISLCMFSCTMPCISSTIVWLAPYVHRGSIDKHVRNSSISYSNGYSPTNMVHDSLVSLAIWLGWSKETSKYSCGCGETNMLLIAINICSSWEAETPTTTRIWQSILGHSSSLNNFLNMLECCFIDY